MITRRITSLILMLMLSVTTANSTSFTTTDPNANNLYVNGGTTVNGVFDLATLLPPEQYSSLYDIQNGSITLNFYGLSSQNGESVTVTIDGITQSWNAPYNAVYGQQYGIVSYGYSYYSYSCGWWSTCWGSYSYPIYGYQTVQTGYDYSGSGSLTFNFDSTTNQSIFNDLRDDGKVSYTAMFFGSTTNLVNASLTANVNSNPVPEPTTILLLGSGLAGLAFWRKRKQLHQDQKSF